jgi:hypothetical protein
MACRSSASALLFVLFYTAAPSAAAPGARRPQATAQTPDTLIDRGLAALRTGRYQAALDAFLEAQEISPGPRATAMVAQAQHALQRWADAELNYMEALAAAGDPWIQRNRAAIEKKLAEVRTQVGAVYISGPSPPPPDAEVRINGDLLGLLPLRRAVSVPKGPARIAVRAPGFKLFETTIEVIADRMTTVQVVLQRDDHRAPPLANEMATLAPAGPGAAAAEAGMGSGASAEAEPPASVAPSEPLQPLVGASLVGLGLAGVVIGGVAVAYGSTRTCSGGPPSTCPERDQNRKWGLIGSAVGAALLGAGALVIWTADDGNVAVALPLSRSAALSLTARF